MLRHRRARVPELLTADLDRAASGANSLRTSFVAMHRPEGADGQVMRALGRFGLVAAAGELAIDMGVLPWVPGEAGAAALRCFQDWVEVRGGVEPAEVTAAVEQSQAVCRDAWFQQVRGGLGQSGGRG